MRSAIVRDDWVEAPLSPSQPALVTAHVPLDERLLSELVELAVHSTPRSVLERIQACEGELSAAEVLLDYVGPVADHLGVCWRKDTLGLMDVTVGANTLQRVADEVGEQAEGPLLHNKLVVLIAAPGEQHTLPLHTIGEAVRSDGWPTHLEAQMEISDLIELVAAEDVGLIGVTCKDPALLAGLESFVSSIKQAARTPLKFVLGGCVEVEPFAEELGFSFVSSGRALRRHLV